MFESKIGNSPGTPYKYISYDFNNKIIDKSNLLKLAE